MIACILAKNEEPNIARSVGALRVAGLRVIVLDSGSTDRTAEIARAAGAEVESYVYVSHVVAYEQICKEKVAAGEAVLILDADMIVSAELVKETQQLLENGAEAVLAPVDMYWEGMPLKHGSLYPPKAIGFRAGKHYFEAVGHGERLRDDVRRATTRNHLSHDDRKSFESYIESQLRYARNLEARAATAKLTWRDRVRRSTPLMVLLAPFVSYILRGGFLSGKAGLGYALDRLIAEAIMFRQSLFGNRAPQREKSDR